MQNPVFRLHTRRFGLGFALAVLVLATSGCGWAFVSGPPPAAQRNAVYIPCTDSKTLSHLDAAMAALQVLNILYVSSMDDFDYAEQFEDTPKSTVIGIQAALGTMWAFSARSGYSKVNACRAARMASPRGGAAEEAWTPQVALTPPIEAAESESADDTSEWRLPMIRTAEWPTLNVPIPARNQR